MITRLFEHKKISLAQYSDLERKYLEGYYREFAALDAKQLRESLKSPVEKYRERSQWLNDMTRTGILGKGDQAKLDEKEREGLLKSLGVSDAEGDYRRGMKDLLEARRSGIIDEGQFGRARDRLRQSALSAMNEGTGRGEIKPVSALEVGSAAAHAMMVQANLPDPKLEVARRSLAVLEKIEQKLGIPQGEVLQ